MRFFDAVLIPNRIINNGRNVKVPAVVFIKICPFVLTNVPKKDII